MIPAELRSALDTFANSASALYDVWTDAMRENPAEDYAEGYPAYLPDFFEFVADVREWITTLDGGR